MTKRRGTSRIPGEDVIILRLVAEQLDSVLATLAEHEAGVLRMRFGLLDGRPRSTREIAAIYGITAAGLRQIEAKAMTKMRHQSRSQMFRNFLDDGSFPVFDRTRIRNLTERGLLRCPRHGWVESDAARHCARCPCPLREPTARGGRRQVYFSNACRQMAHRQRHAANAT